MPIINSMLDTDLYKLTMQRAVLAHCKGVPVTYRFINRRPEGKFNEDFLRVFQSNLDGMADLRLTNEEVGGLLLVAPFLGEEYVRWLHAYRYNPKQVSAKVVNGELDIEIKGPWEQTILWEVPLMALISEVFFGHCDTDWNRSGTVQDEKLRAKAAILKNIPFADFGTRRRRSFETQDMVVRFMKKLAPSFRGTSNVRLAITHDVKAIGTMAHEWIMGLSVLEGLKHANRHALRVWSDVYKGNLGIALTDTFGTDAFYEDFDGYLGRLFDGVRHDSGDAFSFVDKTVAAYKKLGIQPMTRTIVFSDGLTPEDAVKIAAHCEGKIRYSFGIGTNFTNDYNKNNGSVSKPLNMVIKLAECNGVPVVKLSDVSSKAIGDRDALRVARWTFFNTPLDVV
jgi:nicotinate phosphoribosyltransferase